MGTPTQVLLGAAVGQAVGGRLLGRAALAGGALAGRLPDLDLVAGRVARLAATMRYHRGPAHSFLITPFLELALGALLAVGSARLAGWRGARTLKLRALDRPAGRRYLDAQEGDWHRMNLFPLIAEVIERDPTVLDRAMDTLERWETAGMAPASRLAQWRGLLDDARRSPAGMTALLDLLRDDGPAARRLKDFAPFAGVLTREQRRTAFTSCSYDH